jgi:hypothetical protein
VRFAYLALPVLQSAPSLRGAVYRYRPVVPIHLLSSANVPPVDACIDCAADDTVFPLVLAARLGINLAGSPVGAARAVGGLIAPVFYAPVTLLLSDGSESCTWDTIVGFSTVTMRWALLGHASFLEYFDVHLLGNRHEVHIVPNAAFSGKHIAHTTAPP